MGKVILTVIDSLGIGEMEDVAVVRKEDMGSNTLKHVLEHNRSLNIPTLQALGIINALDSDIEGYERSDNCIYGKCALKYLGADSFLGHNEIVAIDFNPFIPHAFSHFVNKIFNKLSYYGYKLDLIEKNKLRCLVIDNEIIIGDNLEGEKGQLYSVIASKNVDENKHKNIAGMVRQIVDVPRISVCSCFVDIEELIKSIDVEDDKYIGVRASQCDLYNKDYKVSYFINSSNKIYNTIESCIDLLLKRNIHVTLIGKVCDLLAYKDENKEQFKYEPFDISTNFSRSYDIEKYNEISTEKIEKVTLEKIRLMKDGLIFINFQEADNAGHVCDAELYGKNLEKIDKVIGKIIDALAQGDLLIITADHGNDPCIGHNKHTREYVPVLLYRKGLVSKDKKTQSDNVVNLGNKTTLNYINNVVLKYFNCTI